MNPSGIFIRRSFARCALPGAILLLALGEVERARAQEVEHLTFCVADDNMPMSQDASPPGFEVELARAIAARAGAEVRFTWLEPEERTEEALATGRCDAAPGAVADPDPMAGGRPMPGLRLSVPYARVGYLLIGRPGARPVESLTDVGDDRIAVEGESIVVYTLRQRGHRVHVLHDTDAVIEAVADGRAEYGYIWGPLAAWLLRQARDVTVLPMRVPAADQWQLAFAIRESDEAVRQVVNRAIEDLIASGTIARLAERYHVSCCDARVSDAAKSSR